MQVTRHFLSYSAWINLSKMSRFEYKFPLNFIEPKTDVGFKYRENYYIPLKEAQYSLQSSLIDFFREFDTYFEDEFYSNVEHFSFYYNNKWNKFVNLNLDLEFCEHSMRKELSLYLARKILIHC